MNFLEFYQNLPSKINPIALKVGFIQIGWYGIMYIFSFLTVYLLLRWRIKKNNPEGNFSWEKIESLLIWLIVGAILGGRLGYALFYNPSHFFFHPLKLISPFDTEGNFIGIYGMSYHGGALGAIFFGWIFSKKNKIDFWKLSDFVVPAIPAGYFFGRIGNFLNGELYGKITNSRWGINFLNPENLSWELRIPSQFIEAFLEGLILFIILWFFRNKREFRGNFLAIYLLGYGIFRFLVEFVRESDFFIGPSLKIEEFMMTSGQIYSILMVILAGIIFFWKKRLKKPNDGV